jgi:hypothetical protein
MTETTQSGAFVPAVIEQSNDLDSALRSGTAPDVVSILTVASARNTRYQADATPYLGRTCTGRERGPSAAGSALPWAEQLESAWQ